MARLLRLGLLAAFVGALAACGGSTDEDSGAVATGAPISFEQLSLAVDTSADATSGRFVFSMEMSTPGAPQLFALSGEGAFDTASERASLELDLSSFGALLGGLLTGLGGADAPDFDDPDAWRIAAVKDGPIVYVRFPAIADQLPAGKSWVRTDERQKGAVEGVDFAQLDQLTGVEPREMLSFLRAVSGEIETVGTERLRGVETTHYRATINPGGLENVVPPEQREALRLADQVIAQSGLGNIPVDVWLDSFGLVRKLTMAVTATQPGTTDSGTATMTFELYDYGKNVEIELPPASQVVDAPALKR